MLKLIESVREIKNFNDFIASTKLNEIFNKKQIEAQRLAELEAERKRRNVIITILAIVGGIAVIGGIAYLVYRYLTPDYLEDFDDDLDDDFDDDFFEDDSDIDVE